MKAPLLCLGAFSLAASLFSMIGCSSSSSNGTPDGGTATPDASTDATTTADGGTDGSSADGSASDGGADGSASDGSVADCPIPTSGPTLHTGEVTGAVTWTAAGSPHILQGNVNVRDGATLTIEPCAEVQAAKDVRLSVAFPLTPNTGTLIAEGTAQHPIRFSGQGGARWANLYVVAPGTARLKYVTLEGGGSSDGSDDGSTLHVVGDGVLPADPTILLDHVTIKGSTGTGLWMASGATFLPGSTDLVVTGSGSVAAPYPVRLEEHSMDAFPTGTFTGNKIDEIRLLTFGDGVAGDGLTLDATLHERGVPYHVDGSFYIGRLGMPRATMTIEPGVTMKFEAGKSLNVQIFTGTQPAGAALVAVGTAAKPIVFTSASATPSPGDWAGIWFGGALEANNKLDYVRVEYAGASCGCSLLTCSNITKDEGAIILNNPAPGPFITNSTIASSALHGIVQGFEGTFVNMRPTNTFTNLAGCPQTLPRVPSPGSCPNPAPACDGL